MKRLLFLLVCVLLLLFATAAPALADDYFYGFSPYHEDPFRVDMSEGLAVFLEEGYIPADSHEVIFGMSWTSLNRGLVLKVPDIFRMELSVTGPYPAMTVRAHCDQSDCRQYWSALYRWNERLWASPDWQAIPNHPEAAAAGIWSRNWWVSCGTLPAGKYTVEYREILTRTLADPWTWPGPGIQYPPYDTGVVEYTFWVGPPVS